MSLVLLPLASLSIRVSGWRATMRRFDRLTSHPTDDPLALMVAPDAARIVRVAATYGPFHGKCLSRSVVLHTLLRRMGVAADILLGVRRGDRGVEAHAWVEAGGCSLDDTVTAFEPFRTSSAEEMVR